MNFKSIIVAGLSVATLAISLPAHADTATVVDSYQGATVTGTRNVTGQNNATGVVNAQSGRRSLGNTGSSVTNTQTADVLGKDNRTIQNNAAGVVNLQRRTTR
jgi:hypothetical protein